MQFRHAPLLATLIAALLLSACAGGTANTPTTDTTAPTEAAPAFGAPGAATADPATAPTAAATAAAPTEAAPAGGQAATTAPATDTTIPVNATGQRLQVIRDRGQLICGVNDQVPGFGSVDSAGDFSGFDIDFCKAIAAAIFGDPEAVQYRPLSAQERLTAVQSGEVDVLIRNTTWTLTRDTANALDFAPVNFYDGQGMMVRTADGITELAGLDGATICVQSGTTTELNLADNFRELGLSFTPAVFEDANATFAAYDAGQCDAVTTDKSGLASRRLSLQAPNDHIILDATLSKEPLAPSVLQGDPQWHDLVSWVVYGLITAEELKVTTENVESLLTSESPNIRRLLGVEGELGAGLGVENDFMVNVIQAVGNYGEIYDRHLGPETPINIPRGPNALYADGGLVYAIPFR